MNDGKEKVYMGHLSCKSHTARTEKDLYRICPSKLSKRELEDLYFALLEQNVHLKKTINDQREQIKVLNTKVQRMTVQKPVLGYHNKEFYVGNKGIINEQKECIADLQKANERLSERIRILNMRLCSAKQFLKRSPTQSASRCNKCLTSNASIKNSSLSALNSKRSESNMKTDISTCELEKHDIPIQLAEITSSKAEIPVQDEPCKQNECRTEIDELKKKVASLEETRNAQEVSSLRAQAAGGARAEHLARIADLLRDSRALNDDLTTQLRLERSRVLELETQLRAARLSRPATDGLKNPGSLPYKLSDVSKVDPPVTVLSDWEDSPPIVMPNNSGMSIAVQDDISKPDGPENEEKRDEEDIKAEKEAALQKQGDHILGQIASLQSQLDSLKINSEHIPESLGAESSLSHDIFSTSRFKTVANMEDVPTTSTDVLNSQEGIQDGDADAAGQGQDRDQGYEPEYQHQIPAPLRLDAPRYSLGDAVDAKIDETTNRNSESTRSSKGSVKINLGEPRTKNEVIEEENKIVDCLDKSNDTIRRIFEEGTDEAYKKYRRSSLKSRERESERKASKEAGVRYGHTQTYPGPDDEGSGPKPAGRGNDFGKYYVEPDDGHDSDPGVRYGGDERATMRRIRYPNDGRADPFAARASGTPARPDGRRAPHYRSASRDAGPALAYPPPADGRERGASEYETNDFQLCAGRAVVCTCAPAGPAPRALRTCGGGLAAVAGDRLRTCRCGEHGEPRTPRPSTAAASPGGGWAREVREVREAREAREAREDREGRAALRIDREVASPAWSPRTEGPRPSGSISPGEEKGPSTASVSCGSPDRGWLSEGEVPAARDRRRSATEDKMTEAAGGRPGKMEAALRAISEELTRCRELLQQRGGELSKVSRETSVMTEEAVPLALRRAEAKSRIRDSYTPKCIFTLHVGTVVLSDQAVLVSRDKSLSLSWQFYNQAPSMTRLMAGRVMNFDFSTEYDLNITEHFLYYLKHEEMPIIIAEIDKQDEAFASCSLPLRDALLHPNRRVDMSLVLVSGRGAGGPAGGAAGGPRARAGGAEAGVLDVWCALRVDASALPAINTAIVRPSSLKTLPQSSMMERILDDEQTSDSRFSREQPLQRRAASDDNQSYRSVTMDKLPEINPSYNEVFENEVPTNIRSVNDFNQAVASEMSTEEKLQSVDITVLWLALNEDCRAMSDPKVRKLYVAYSFLGRSGADLETPVSLPKPKHYMDKCHFLFKKTFIVNECDMVALGQLAQYREPVGAPEPQRAVVFSVVSEPAEDPLGLNSCEDVGYAYLYLGDVLSRGSVERYTGVLVVRDARGVDCGALAVRIEGLELLRLCRELAGGQRTD